MTNTIKLQFTQEEMEILNYRLAKPFSELTEAEQQEHLQIYEKQKEIIEEYNKQRVLAGFKDGLFTVIRTFDLRQNRDNSLSFGFEAEDYKTGEYKMMNVYIPKGKKDLMDFYLNLKPGTTVHIDYKEDKVDDIVFNNIRQVSIRQPENNKEV